ncbi:MAG: YcgL domain-containing protein [Gammaproteobacteria bacterium]
MQCFIYKSSKKDELYVYLLKKDDFSALPPTLFHSIGTPGFVMEIELTPERKLARADSTQVIRQLQEKGFFVQMPPTQIPAPDSLQ